MDQQSLLEPICVEISTMCELSHNEKAEYESLEGLCQTYGLEHITMTINRRRDVLNEAREFFEKSLN